MMKTDDDLVEKILDEFVEGQIDSREDTWREVCEDYTCIELTPREAEKLVSLAIKKVRHAQNEDEKRRIKERIRLMVCYKV